MSYLNIAHAWDGTVHALITALIQELEGLRGQLSALLEFAAPGDPGSNSEEADEVGAGLPVLATV